MVVYLTQSSSLPTSTAPLGKTQLCLVPEKLWGTKNVTQRAHKMGCKYLSKEFRMEKGSIFPKVFHMRSDKRFGDFDDNCLFN